MRCSDHVRPTNLYRLPAPPMRALAALLLIAFAWIALPRAAWGWCDLSIDDAPVAVGDAGPGWAYPAEGELHLNGYDGGPITCDGDLVLTLEGANSATDSAHRASATSTAAIEVWGNLNVRGEGALNAAGVQHGAFVFEALKVEGAHLACSAAGTGVVDGVIAGLRAQSVVLQNGAVVDVRATASDVSSEPLAVGAYVGSAGADSSASALYIDASTLHAAGPSAGVLASGIALNNARVTIPADGVVCELVGHVSGLSTTACEAALAADVASGAAYPAAEVRIEPYAATNPVGSEAEPEPAEGDPQGDPSASGALDASGAEAKTEVTKIVVTTQISKKGAKKSGGALPKTGDSLGGVLSAAFALVCLGVLVVMGALRTQRKR